MQRNSIVCSFVVAVLIAVVHTAQDLSEGNANEFAASCLGTDVADVVRVSVDIEDRGTLEVDVEFDAKRRIIRSSLVKSLAKTCASLGQPCVQSIMKEIFSFFGSPLEIQTTHIPTPRGGIAVVRGEKCRRWTSSFADTNLVTPRRFHIIPTGGIGNRLHAIAGMMDVADVLEWNSEQRRVSLSVRWIHQNDAAIAQSFESLFDVPLRRSLFEITSANDPLPRDCILLVNPSCNNCVSFVTENANVSEDRHRGWIVSDRPLSSWWQREDTDDAHDVVVHSWYHIGEDVCGVDEHANQRYHPGLAFFDFFSMLRPGARIATRTRDLVREVRKTTKSPFIVGVHLRLRTPYTLSFCPLDEIAEFLFASFGHYEDPPAFFVATDDPSAVGDMRREIASRFPDVDVVDSRSSRQGISSVDESTPIEDSVTDLFVLSQADMIVCNTISTFSLSAAHMGNARHVIPLQTHKKPWRPYHL